MDEVQRAGRTRFVRRGEFLPRVDRDRRDRLGEGPPWHRHGSGFRWNGM